MKMTSYLFLVAANKIQLLWIELNVYQGDIFCNNYGLVFVLFDVNPRENYYTHLWFLNSIELDNLLNGGFSKMQSEFTMNC